MTFLHCSRRRPGRAALLTGATLLGLLAFAAVPACWAGGSSEVPEYTLDECLALARKQNPDVLAAGKRLEATRATITTAKAGIYPSVTSTGYYQYREQSLTSEGGVEPTNRKEDYSADARISQNLYSAGAVRNRIAVAKLQTQAGTLAFQAQVDATTLAVRLAFYQTLYAEGSIGVRREALDLLGAQLKDQQDRLAAGSVGQLNVNRAQVSLTNERPALLEAQASVRTAYVNLAQVLALTYPANAEHAPLRIRGGLNCPPLHQTLADCLDRAKAARPEIAARQLAVDVLTHQLVIEKSTTRPQVSAFASYDVYSEPSVLSARDSFSGYTVGLQATWTIFDGFATRGRVRGVKAQQGEAQAQLAATRQQVEADVRTAFYDLQQAAEILRPEAENIRLANETLGLTTHNFDAGLSTQLDVLQTRVDLTRARLTELGGRLAYATAFARLERAMGVGQPLQGSATVGPVTNQEPK